MNSKDLDNRKADKLRQPQKRPWQTPRLQEADYEITGSGSRSFTDGINNHHRS